MGYKLYSNSGNLQYGIQKYIVDTEADLASLPTGIKAGSSIFVIETSKTLVMNTQGNFIEVASDVWEDFEAGGN